MDSAVPAGQVGRIVKNASWSKITIPMEMAGSIAANEPSLAKRSSPKAVADSVAGEVLGAGPEEAGPEEAGPEEGAQEVAVEMCHQARRDQPLNLIP